MIKGNTTRNHPLPLATTISQIAYLPVILLALFFARFSAVPLRTPATCRTPSLNNATYSYSRHTCLQFFFIIKSKKGRNRRKRVENAKTLTVGLLEACTSTAPAELLGLASSGIGDQQRPVVGQQRVLEGLFGRFVNVFLVVGDQTLGDGLSDRINLGSVTTTLDAQTNVDVGESLSAQDEHRLHHLLAKALRLDQVEWRSVELHEPLAVAGDVGDSNGRFLCIRVGARETEGNNC